MADTKYVPELKKLYRETVKAELSEEFGYKTPMQLPALEKIVVSMGVGEAIQNKKLLDAAVGELALITGQKAVKTKARKSVANFKVREGMEVGARVTLRGDRMYDFLYRLLSVALPRVKDFRGLNPNSFDGHGNYSLGLTEQLVFPELNPDKYSKSQGMNVTLVTSTDRDDEARELLRKLGLPLRAA